jgi:DNA-binding transcriptional regulator GbsR (MarR family)
MRNKTTLLDVTELNKLDWTILIILLDNYISKRKISIGELTKQIQVAPVNVWKHLKKLQNMDLIIIPNVQRGKKKFISFNDNIKMEETQKDIFLKFTKEVLIEVYKNNKK